MWFCSYIEKLLISTGILYKAYINIPLSSLGFYEKIPRKDWILAFLANQHPTSSQYI